MSSRRVLMSMGMVKTIERLKSKLSLLCILKWLSNQSLILLNPIMLTIHLKVGAN